MLFHGAIAVPSVMLCHCRRRRCCCGHRRAGGVQQWLPATVATPGEWHCKTGSVRRLAVANGSNIFKMLLVNILFISVYTDSLLNCLTLLHCDY